MGTEPLTTREFQTRFENLDIYIQKIEIETINDVTQNVFPYNTPFSAVWHNTNTHFYLPNKKEIVGKIFLLLKSQAEKSKLALWIDVQLRTLAEDDSFANMVCKLVQYMFEWVNKYVK